MSAMYANAKRLDAALAQAFPGRDNPTPSTAPDTR
jgi:hypothetical protein